MTQEIQGKELTDSIAQDLYIETLEKTLSNIREDAKMALAGTWDKSRDGFQAQIDVINKALNIIPYTHPVLFHAGCITCTQQSIHGYEFCKGCQCFDGKWSLPNLNNFMPTEADKLRDKLKE